MEAHALIAHDTILLLLLRGKSRLTVSSPVNHLDWSRLQGEHVAFSACGVGVVDLGPATTMLAVNAIARQLLGIAELAAAEVPTRLVAPTREGGQFRFIDHEADAALQKAMRSYGDAPAQNVSSRPWFRIGRASQPELVVFVECRERARQAVHAWRLHVLDPYRARVGASRSWCALWNLTEGECRVAAELLQGRSPSEIAHDSGVSTNAVRFHIKSLLSKTRTARQSQLLLLLSRTTCINPA